jgi:hypothetical protein
MMTIQRQVRNDLLRMSDWTQLPDSPLTSEKKSEWATYRQALRDLDVNGDDPTQPDWPTPPTSAVGA